MEYIKNSPNTKVRNSKKQNKKQIASSQKTWTSGVIRKMENGGVGEYKFPSAQCWKNQSE